MSKSKVYLDTLNNLFGLREGDIDSMELSIKVKNLLSEALKKCPYSRHEVAAKLSKKTGKEITYHTLNSWTAESKELRRFPVEFLPAFCHVTGDFTILKVIANIAGGFFIEGEEAIYTQLGRIQAEEAKLEKEKKEIQKRLEDLEKGEIKLK